MLIAELEHPGFGQFDLSSLRTGLMAGSPCSVELMKRVCTEMHMRKVGVAYGMTVTSPVSFQTSVSDTFQRRVSTIGRVQPHLEVKFVDSNGTTAPRGTPGELRARGYSVMLAYWGEPEKPPRRSIPKDGCTPETSRSSTRNATPTSSGESRT